MRPGIAAVASLLAAVSLGGQSSFAQQNSADSDDRLVIGLVLSGGGARGGAHLGVLKALEELRVPVDRIAGTSIGAAIGGLYASGMTIGQLEEFVNGIDWDEAFLNSTPRRLESFRRKREDDLFLLEVSPGFDDEGISLPAGVVQGQVIDTIMARVTMPVAAVDDFDQLTIPFRAVAGDLESGEAVILDHGNLGRAIRASMSVPAIMAPMEIDGRDLVDGGIAMNLPVEVAQAMGAERIIAVDISEKLKSADEIKSVFDVIGQLTSMLTLRGIPDQIARLDEGDILFVPEFEGDYSSTSFSKLAETIEAGYQQTMARQELFAPYQLSPEAYAAWQAARPNPRITEQPTIEFVRTGDTSPLAASVIEARIGDIRLGEPLDLDAVETALNRVHGLGSYSNVRYALVEEAGRRGLDLQLVDRSTVNQFGQLGLRYSSASDEDALFGIALGYLRPAINPLGGEWRAVMQFGDEPGFFADLYQPLGPKALTFINPSFDVASDQLNVFVDQELAAEARIRSAIFELGVGRELLDWAEIRGGFRVGAGDTRLRVGDPAAVPYDSFHRGEVFARFSVDTLDNISFPREGTFAIAEWRGSNMSVLAGDDDYGQVVVNVVHAKTWGPHTLLSTLRWDATISGRSPVYGLFGLGGFRDLSGFNSQEITGQNVARLGGSYYRRVGNLPLFPAFVGASVEVGNVWERRSEISLTDSIWGGSLWAGVDTPAGPVFLAYGSSEGGNHAFYVLLGRLF